jgi:TRAP-type C4-dicarboxylate transport system permease small subunit
MSETTTQKPPAGDDLLLRAVRIVLGSIAALLIFAMMSITVVDVIGRYGFNRPLPGAFELTEIMLAITIFVALPLVTLENNHITVSLITEQLSERTRRIQGCLAAAFSAVLLAFVAWRLYRHGLQLSSYGDVTIFLRMPKGPLAFLMATLTAIGALAAAVLAVRLVTGRADTGTGIQL